MTEINIDNKIQLLHNSVKAFIEAGKTDAEITGWLNKEGIDDHYAATIIENVRNDFHDKKEFWKHILMGSFMTIGRFVKQLYVVQVCRTSWLWYVYYHLGNCCYGHCNNHPWCDPFQKIIGFSLNRRKQ